MIPKHICFIVENYPTPTDPVFTFVKQLVDSISDQGIKCSVIAPQSITKKIIRKKDKRPHQWFDLTPEGRIVDIYQPSYISFSKLKIFNKYLSNTLKERSVIKCFNDINITPDVLYGHFWHSGIIASKIAITNKLPVIVASGESEISVRNIYNAQILNKYLPQVKGVICVSKKNKDESLKLELAPKEAMTVIPNAIDEKVFYIENKNKARKKLGFDEKDFIVIFTGTFNHRKGPLRLKEAVDKIPNCKVIFIGSGHEKPSGENIIFCDKVSHNEIVHYLNAADIFVLPTLAEGCSNAIIEAMACGLPIVSSDLSFNDEILNGKNSIRINSNDINEIASAISFLKENPTERLAMAKESQLLSESLTIKNRANQVINFIGKKI